MPPRENVSARPETASKQVASCDIELRLNQLRTLDDTLESLAFQSCIKEGVRMLKTSCQVVLETLILHNVGECLGLRRLRHVSDCLGPEVNRTRLRETYIHRGTVASCCFFFGLYEGASVLPYMGRVLSRPYAKLII